MISQRLSLNMPRLSRNQRIQALTMFARGDNVSNVSTAFGCHRNTIIRLRQRFQQTGGVADRRRLGRPRGTNPRTDRFITLTHLRRRFQTATSSARLYGISKQTVLRRRQARQPIRLRRPYVGQVLTARHRAGRLQRAQRRFRWGRQQWARVLFSSLGLTLVIMTVEFEFLEEQGNVLLIIVSLRGTDLEVGVLWYGVALWAEGKQILCKATSLLNQNLQPEAVPFLQRHGPAILMHDNARLHVARICRRFINRNNVKVLPWPAVSPDMNPIEHIWDYVGRKVRARGNGNNLRDLGNALIQEWNNIPNIVIRRYVRTMRSCLSACMKWSRWPHSILTTVNIEFPILAE